MSKHMNELEGILHLNGCQQYTQGWNDAKDGKDIDTDKIEELEKATLAEVQAHTDKAVKEARLDELKYLYKIAHRRKDTEIDDNTYLSVVFEKELIDRIKELQEGKE
jgi:hypothetical protein